MFLPFFSDTVNITYTKSPSKNSSKTETQTFEGTPIVNQKYNASSAEYDIYVVKLLNKLDKMRVLTICGPAMDWGKVDNFIFFTMFFDFFQA